MPWKVIVAAEVTNEANDKKQAKPMVEQIENNTGEKPKELSGNAGYYSEANVELLENRLIEPLIPPDKKKYTEAEAPPLPRGTEHFYYEGWIRYAMNGDSYAQPTTY